MIYKNASVALWAASLALALAGCGGSGGGSTAGIDRTGQPTPAAAALGTITGFGSIIVNGVRYETTSTEFRVDDSAGQQSDLAVGDVVVVQGSVDSNGTTGRATAVFFDEQVQGPIASKDATANTFVVLGQTVRVGVDTSFDDRIQPASLAGLAVGQIVEVSGLVQSDGSIAATRVEPKPAGASSSELELTGVVSNLDTAQRRFTINAQVVDYSAVTQLQDFPTGGIANQQTVEVKGGAVTGGIWRPSRIEFQINLLAGATGAPREIEGFITRFGSAADFTVAGLTVTTNAQTVVTGGQLATLALNVKVEVEGALDAAGTLVASRVDIRRSSAVRLFGRVQSVNAAGGTFAVLGITVRVDALTRIEDKSNQQLRPFSLSNLTASDTVEVRGSEQAGNQIIASLVEREDPRSATELQGFVQSVAAPNLTILGVGVSTAAGTSFFALDGTAMTSTQFFTAVDPGDLVKATGTEVGTQALQASQVEFE